MGSAAGERLLCLAPREASIFACLVDTVAAPEPLLPPVARTDCALFFDRWMAASPAVNALGMRALLLALELMPLALGHGGRFRRLPPEERARFIARIERTRSRPVRQLVKVMKGAAFLAYYGDDNVMKLVGYDAEANLRRARALRAKEGRP